MYEAITIREQGQMVHSGPQRFFGYGRYLKLPILLWFTAACIAFRARFYWELTPLLKTSGLIISFEEDLVVIQEDGACISTIIYFQDSTPGNDASCSSSFTVARSSTALEADVEIWGWYDDALPQTWNLSQMAFVYFWVHVKFSGWSFQKTGVIFYLSKQVSSITVNFWIIKVYSSNGNFL